MNPKLIATLLVVLGVTELKKDADGYVSMSKDDIEKIEKAYKDASGKDLTLEGLQYVEGKTDVHENEILLIESKLKEAGVKAADAGAAEQQKPEGKEGGANTTPAANSNPPAPPDGALKNQLDNLQAQLQKLVEDKSKDASLIKQLQADIEKLGNSAETITIPAKQNSDTQAVKQINPWDKTDASRPWNQKAQAAAEGKVIIFADSIDYTTLVNDLGDYFRTRGREEITSFTKEMDDLRKIFPMRSNIQDEEVMANVFLTEFSQAYQAAFTAKGSFKFEPEKVKMYPVKLDHKFSELKKIEKNWLGYLNENGSDAIKMPFVKFLIQETLKQAKNEQQMRRIKGVYKAPTPNVAGYFLNAAQGLLKLIKVKIANKQIKPFAIGELTDNNICDKIYEAALLIPEHIRNLGGLTCYLSEHWKYKFYKRLEALHGAQTDYKPGEEKLKFLDNISIKPVPNMGNSHRLIFTFEGNIVLCEDAPGEDTKLNFEQEDRTLKVWADWKESVHIISVGKVWANLDDADYEHQLIWVSDVDEPASYFIPMAADDVTPSALEHTSLESVANTGATAITDIDDTAIGDTIRLKCGSDTNPITIAKAGKFAKISAAWNPAKGDTITLYKRGASDWIDLARTTVEPTAIAFTKDDATPSVAAGTVFVTVANDAPLAITKLDDAVVGTTYTIYGGSATNSSTIADAGNFSLTAAMTLSVGAWIKLYARGLSDFVEVARG